MRLNYLYLLERKNQSKDDSQKDDSKKYKSAVAVVQYKDKWLLGLSTATDDRGNKWSSPGGGIKTRETPQKAAEREAFEETGIRCKAVGKPFEMPGKSGVAFVHCKVDGVPRPFKANNEFAALGFFTKKQMKTLSLYSNVLKLIDRVS